MVHGGHRILLLPDRAQALTAKKIQAAARKYFSSDNLLIARLLPAAAQGAGAKKAE